jgi:hypothetical protein
MTAHSGSADILRPLRAAIAAGDPDAILEAIPEPPHFLAALFRLEPSDRDAIITGVLPAFTGDEDRWEVIEASAMDTVVHPERGAFVAIAPLIPDSLMDDARMLVASIRDPETRRVMDRAVGERAATLGRA